MSKFFDSVGRFLSVAWFRIKVAASIAAVAFVGLIVLKINSPAVVRQVVYVPNASAVVQKSTSVSNAKEDKEITVHAHDRVLKNGKTVHVEEHTRNKPVRHEPK